MSRLPILLLTLVAGCATGTDRPDPRDRAIPPAGPSPRSAAEGAVVHLFEWRWDDVAEECETFLGPAGYTAVQVSPVVEHHVVVGRPWWERYQPVSYRIDTRSGDRTAFADMVSRCRRAGVRVMVDVVLNHMADADLRHGSRTFTGRGTAGSTFGPYEYPGLYTREDFHHCGLTENDDIADWEDPGQVWNCELVDLADLDTARPLVRARLVAFLRDLASLGVEEFRVDTGRHIPPEDLAAILDSVRVEYAALEVTNAGWIGLYLPIAPVTDFTYGPAVSAVFRTGSLDALVPAGPFWAGNPHPGHSSLVFLSNHDNQRGHGEGRGVLTFRDGRLHELATAFMLAFGRGRPRVMSSYAFDDPSQGPPTRVGEAIARVHGPDGLGCGTEWICEHRWPLVTGFVGFERATRGEPVQRFVSDGPDRIAFARGRLGFAAFNRSAEPWEATFDTGLPAGLYCDAGVGPATTSAPCPGERHEAAPDGSVRLTVPPMGAAGIFVGR